MEDIAAVAGVTKLILYRHFESKEELYRAVLEEVSGSLAAAIRTEFEAGRRRGVIARALLDAAREDPDGFRLLWRHSAREPNFAEYASDVHDKSTEFASRLLNGRIDPALLPWAAATITDFLIAAVLNWLDQGDPRHDERFLAASNASLQALTKTWSGSRPGSR